MLSKKSFFKAVTAAALAVCLSVLGCGSGEKEDDKKPDATPNNPVTGGGNITGSWLVYDGSNIKGYITLEASGKLYEGTFRRVGSYWIHGVEEGSANWTTARQTLYVASPEWTDSMRYALSGDNLTVTSCYAGYDGSGNGTGQVCDAAALKRIGNLTVFAASLGGNVYENDSRLYMSTVYRDLMWRLSGGNSGAIDFDAICFYYGGRYLNGVDIEFSEGAENLTAGKAGLWFADGAGNRLTLLTVEYDCGYDTDDCEAVVSSERVLSYSVTGSGSGARLTIDDEDVWQPANNAAGRGVAKLRQDNGKGKRAFSPLALLPGMRR